MKSYLLIAIPGLILCATCRRHSDEYDRGRFSGLKLLREGKLMLRAIVIATAIGLAAPSYAQVRSHHWRRRTHIRPRRRNPRQSAA